MQGDQIRRDAEYMSTYSVVPLMGDVGITKLHKSGYNRLELKVTLRHDAAPLESMRLVMKLRDINDANSNGAIVYDVPITREHDTVNAQFDVTRGRYVLRCDVTSRLVLGIDIKYISIDDEGHLVASEYLQEFMRAAYRYR